MLWYKGPTSTIYRPEKTSEKWLKFILFLLKWKHVKRFQMCLSLMPKLLDMPEIAFVI